MYVWLVEGMDKEAKKKVDDVLRQPPAGVKAEAIPSSNEWAPGAAGADFLAQLAARGGAGRVAVSGNRNVAS